MTSFQIVYWRDIPAQVRAGSGRSRVSRPLSNRFQEAIDEAAMRSGRSQSDAYLAEWRTSDPAQRDGDPAALAEALAAELETAYPSDRLESLAAEGGVE